MDCGLPLSIGSISPYRRIRRLGFVSAVFVFVLASGGAWSKGMGLLPEDESFIDSLPQAQLTRSIAIPDEIDLSHAMPPPADQGEFGACVSYAVGYATMGYFVSQRTGAKPGDPGFTPSPGYLHTQIHDRRESCEEAGANTEMALRYLVSNPIPSRASIGDDLICSPAARQGVQSSLDHGLTGYQRVFSGKRDGRANPLGSVAAIKQELANGYPLPASFRLYCSRPARPGQGCLTTLDGIGRNETYRGSLAGSTDIAGGHSMVVVGYSDRRQAFKIQNSWGPDFADDGFFWMAYDAFWRDVSYVLKPVVRTPPRKPTSARAFVAEGLDLDSCHALTETAGRIDGFVSSDRDRQALAAAVGVGRLGQVDVRPWPICAAMMTLAAPMQAAGLPKVTPISGSSDIGMGEDIAFRVETPSFPSFLYLVYLQADGTVVNLMPRGGPIRRQHAPGTVLTFGDGQEGRQRFYAVPPSGPEAVIAIAARAPIFELEDLEDLNSGQYRISGTLPRDAEGKIAEDQVFLTVLSEALNARPDPDNLAREISADILHLTIRE